MIQPVHKTPTSCLIHRIENSISLRTRIDACRELALRYNDRPTTFKRNLIVHLIDSPIPHVKALAKLIFTNMFCNY